MKKYARTSTRRVATYLTAMLTSAICAMQLAACAAPAATATPTPAPAAAEPTAPTVSRYEGKLVISELMVKNRASLMDETGAFPDWIELENISDEAVDLKGFILADGEDKPGRILPAYTLEPGGRVVIYADSTDDPRLPMHMDFSLSLDETVVLRDADGVIVDTAPCSADKADRALVRGDDGEWSVSAFCTPGYENSDAGYDTWQSTLAAPDGLIISEVVTANAGTLEQAQLGLCDWVELKNNSTAPIDLGDYRLSDDDDALDKCTLPAMTLVPGECVVVICSSDAPDADEGFLRADFDLKADGERLYLSHADGSIRDFVYLHGIPTGGSMGRVTGENGWFYFAAPQPLESKANGARRVSAAPECAVPDGVYNDAASVALKLVSADPDAAIYYTLDGTLPTENSTLYTGTVYLDKTTIVRAIAVAPGALPSEVETFSYIIHEGHNLPVVSLTADDIPAFDGMYSTGRKDMELAGHIAYYPTEGEGFAANCGIDIHGESSRVLPKKNMGVHFRSRYGDSGVDCDVYGGGVTEFKSFVLRAGQDQTRSIIRNELLENLALQFSDKLPTQRSLYCVLYVNGEYNGIYALMEKVNEAHYAALMGVSRESVSVEKGPVNPGSEYYESVIRFARENDLTTAASYGRFCELIDIDCLIDWMIIEGYSANTDISLGNVRYARSTEGDGKWRFVLYDLDATFTTPAYIFANVLKPASTQSADFITQLINNPDFRDRFLTRAGQVLATTLSDENVSAEIVRLADQINSEIDRDGTVRLTTTRLDWETSVQELLDTVNERSWNTRCVEALRQLMELTDDEMSRYFSWAESAPQRSGS